MGGIIILIILGGIVYFIFSEGKKVAEVSVEDERKKFLEKMAEFLEGDCQPIKDREDSYCIAFEFDNEKFFYEDIATKGFSDKVYKVYLRGEVSGQFEMNLVEKQNTKIIQSELVIISDLKEGGDSKEGKAVMPKELERFAAHTNDPQNVSKFLKDAKVVNIFKEFINIDRRGYVSMALKISNGEVVLEFYPSSKRTPDISSIYKDHYSIEKYLKKMVVIIQKVKEIQS